MMRTAGLHAMESSHFLQKTLKTFKGFGLNESGTMIQDFCENTTRTYCFKSMERYSDRSEWEQNAKIFMPDEMEYKILFADIVGEGG